MVRKSFVMIVFAVIKSRVRILQDRGERMGCFISTF